MSLYHSCFLNKRSITRSEGISPTLNGLRISSQKGKSFGSCTKDELKSLSYKCLDVDWEKCMEEMTISLHHSSSLFYKTDMEAGEN
ncbi:hypothetical protein AMECASPLE_019412 [Ameca splendens]|uniref:Uncharacterized protein n=1 Tax=Ameca splendens TaxID=208324 RepID=A0ABV0YE84_9TELE